MSIEIGMENYPLIITVCMGVCFLTLIIIRLLFSPFTFIYYLSIYDNKVIVKWQKNNKLNEEKFTCSKITSEIVPSGRNNPFLKILFKKTDSSELVLKQYYHTRWNKNKMEEIDKLIKNITLVHKSLK